MNENFKESQKNLQKSPKFSKILQKSIENDLKNSKNLKKSLKFCKNRLKMTENLEGTAGALIDLAASDSIGNCYEPSSFLQCVFKHFKVTETLCSPSDAALIDSTLTSTSDLDVGVSSASPSNSPLPVLIRQFN